MWREAHLSLPLGVGSVTRETWDNPVCTGNASLLTRPSPLGVSTTKAELWAGHLSLFRCQISLFLRGRGLCSISENHLLPLSHIHNLLTLTEHNASSLLKQLLLGQYIMGPPKVTETPTFETLKESIPFFHSCCSGCSDEV